MTYINALGVNVDRLVSKFADGSNIGGVAGSEKGCQRMQKDIDHLQVRAVK